MAAPEVACGASAGLLKQHVAVVGAGPAGLIAAEYLANNGYCVTVYDHMASPARKFLLAGRGGLNITHAEGEAAFLARYGGAAPHLRPAIATLTPKALRVWCDGLGQPTFVGSSGRVFPAAFKAAPLLRAWLRRLEGQGVVFSPRHRWLRPGNDATQTFSTPDGERVIKPVATLLALGGASWSRMGSDGAWVDILTSHAICVHPLRAANCGILIDWTPVFADRYEGQPLKRIAISIDRSRQRGEAVITRQGLEGGAVYAITAALRRALDDCALDEAKRAFIHVDLKPDLDIAALALRVDGDRQGRSLPNFLRQSASLSEAAIGLVQEALHTQPAPQRLSTVIKALPLRLRGMQPIDRAISSSGGIAWSSVDAHFMLKALPGLFVAGEMLDWEAPTGGYLLQACFSTGLHAAHGLDRWVKSKHSAASFA